MSYPFKYLREISAQPLHKKAYALYPFDENGKDFCKNILKPAVKKAELRFDSAESLAGANPIIEDILTGIANAQVVIGVLNDRNANVFWEIGIAMSWKPATQVLTIGRKCSNGDKKKHDEKLPFNLQGYHHVFVDTNEPESAIVRISDEISEMKRRHDDLKTELVYSARNALGPAELSFIQKFGPLSQKGHFILSAYSALQQNESFLQPLENSTKPFLDEVTPVGPMLLATHVDGIAMGELCKLGLIACSTAIKSKNVEYSFYWTPLGNCVLLLLEIIDNEERLRRYDKMPPEILNWRGGYLLNRGITL